MFGIGKRPSFPDPPVTSAVNHASKVISRAISRQLNDAHCHLIAYEAVDDAGNGLIADLKHAIRELNLTTAPTIDGLTLQSPLNRRDASVIQVPSLGK